jgi:protein-S-isoprenylcysteine O-methyltransferase Ste14
MRIAEELAIRIGNFFFRYRNGAFPIVVVALYGLVAPPRNVLGSAAIEQAEDVLAVAIALLGLAIRATVIGYAYIRRGGRNRRVYADRLVTGGMFALCRNPLYLGNLLICFGIFLMHGSLLVLLAGFAFYAFVYACIVRAEEAYLLRNFGAAYRAYCADVPRWIPDLARFREATEGMAFKMRRVILKDYTTVATTVSTLSLAQAYEYLRGADIVSHLPHLAFLAAAMVACGIATLVVRAAKKAAASA